jgi:cytosine/creatinine deaminase
VASADWVLRKARVEATSPLVDIAFNNGVIVAMGEDLDIQGQQEWQLNGLVVLPGLIDSHTHLDKTFSTTFNKSGTLGEAIESWQKEAPRVTYEGYAARAMQAVQLAIAKGTTAMRTHIDINSHEGFRSLEAILEVRERFKKAIDIQIVALGQAGTDDSEKLAMQTAFEMGADLVGGAPSLTPDPKHAIDTVFELAEKYSKPIDLHIDETEDPTMLALEYLAEQTISRGMQGQVTAGHCCSLGFVDDATADRIMEKVKEAKLNIITLPSCNLVLMGRGMNPVPRGLTRVKELWGRGINVAAASDNVRDPFNPLGNYDLMHIANLSAHTAHMTGASELEACLQMVTTHAAATLGLTNYGLYEGAQADLVVFDAVNMLGVLSGVPERLATFKYGQCLVRTEVKRNWVEYLYEPADS